MLTRLLTKPEFLATFGGRMVEVTGKEDEGSPRGVLDIWPYVRAVDSPHVPEHVVSETLVEHVYRTSDARYDHVLVPTQRKNAFLAIVVDLAEDQILGHHLLDLDYEYGLIDTPVSE
jgi:hypothetical protein